MERVDLTHEFGTDRQRKWGNGAPAAWEFTHVTFGRLADGRWFAARGGRQADPDDHRLGACVFGTDDRSEHLALRLAYSWMRDGEWEPMPAAFDEHGRPVDGLPWIRSGGGWRLPKG